MKVRNFNRILMGAAIVGFILGAVAFLFTPEPRPTDRIDSRRVEMPEDGACAIVGCQKESVGNFEISVWNSSGGGEIYSFKRRLCKFHADCNENGRWPGPANTPLVRWSWAIATGLLGAFLVTVVMVRVLYYSTRRTDGL